MRVPRASWTTAAPVSTANTTPWAKRLTSATKLSPTRTGMTMQFGHVPSAPPLLASAVESSASPVPWPNCTSSKGSLSLSKKSQPAMLSMYPSPSSSTPSEKVMIRSSGSITPLPLRSDTRGSVS